MFESCCGSVHVQQHRCHHLRGRLLSSYQRGTSGLVFVHTVVHVAMSPSNSPQTFTEQPEFENFEPVVLSCSASSVTVGAVELGGNF